MKKLYCTKLDRPHEETEHCADGCVAVYLASDVDARIAELEAGEGLSVDQALEMQRQRTRIAELERALREIVDRQCFHTIEEMRAIANSGL